MSRILRFFVCLGTLFFAGNALAAGYTCSSLPKYVSCQAGYYMTSSQSSTTYNGTPKTGNYCQPCSRMGSNYTCAGGTAAPQQSAGGYSCPTYKKYTSCSTGYYMTNSSTSTVPDGSSKPGNACRPCSVYGANYTCAGGTAAPQAITVNVTCQAGQYLPKGATSCTRCPAGSYCPGNEKFTGISLVTGATSDKGRYYCEEDTMEWYNGNALGDDSLVGDGMYSNSAEGSSSINQCYLVLQTGAAVYGHGEGLVACRAGDYCNQSGIKIYFDDTEDRGLTDSMPTVGGAEACARGSISGSTGWEECRPCPNGKTSPGTGTSSPSGCNITCSNSANVKEWVTPEWTPNYVSNSCKIASCVACTKGTGVASCSASIVNNTCTYTATCASGYKNPTCNGSSCSCELDSVTCSAGQYLPAGATSCATCPKGYKCPSSSKTYTVSTTADQGNTPCSGSTEYQDATGQTSCKTPNDGYYKKDNTSQQVCGTGYFCKSGVRTACTTYGTGYTTDTTTASVNTKCYLNVVGGKVRNGTTGTTLNTCGAGKYKVAHKAYYGTSYTCDSCPAAESGWTMGTDTGLTNYTACYETKAATSISNYCSAGQLKKNATSATAWGTATISTAFQAKGGSIVKGQTCEQCGAGTYSAGGTATSCSTCDTAYPYSDAGTSSAGSCYKNGTKTGSQLNGSTPTNCYSVTSWNSCTPGTCTYRIYKSGTTTSCTPTNCTKTPAAVTAKSGYYVSGTSCTPCSELAGGRYPNSDNGNTGGASACRTDSLSGQVIATPNASSTTQCVAGTYKAAHTVNYGGTSSCGVCGNNQFSDAGAASCTGCKTANGYTNSGTTAASHAGEASCKATCAAGTYVATAGSACTTVGTGYWGAGGTVSQNTTLGRNQCPEKYRDGAAATQKSDCAVQTTAGKYIAAAKDTEQTKCPAKNYCPSASVKYGATNSPTACPTADATTARTTYPDDYLNPTRLSISNQGWSTGLPAITSCSANYSFTNAAGNFSVESVGYNATTGKYENGGGKYYTLVNAGWYLVDKYSDTYCNTSTNRMYYHNVAECTANSYCPGYHSMPLCSTGTHNDEMGKYPCRGLGNGYDYSPAKSGAATACYLTTTAGKFVKIAKSAEVTCESPYYCPGGVKVNYGSVGGNSNCSDLTGVSVSGGTYTSAAGSSANTACKYTAPSKTITGCKTVTTNTVTYSGTAWPATTYGVTANGGYIISGNNTAAATCSQCSGAVWSAGGTATSCSACPAQTSGWTRNSGTGWTAVTQCNQTQNVGGNCRAGVLKQNATSTTAWGATTISTPLQAKPGSIVNGQKCDACNPGTYSAGGTETSCNACANWTYAASTGMSSCTACPALTSGWAKADSTGTGWKSHISCVQISPKPANCAGGNLKQVAASNGATTWGASAVNSALSSEPGYYINDTACSPCTGATYYGGGTATSCTPCPSIYTSNTTAAKSKAEQCTVQTTGGYYIKAAKDNTQTECDGGYYCPSTTVAYGSTSTQTACPVPADHKRATIPAEYYASSIANTSIAMSGRASAITQCQVLNTYNGTRGSLYDYVTYNTTTQKYDVQGSVLWFKANPGYYLTTATGCGTYAYYGVAKECDKNAYCPGKDKVECNSSNQATVQVEKFGLELCSALGNGKYATSDGGAAAKSTAACYLTTSNSKFVSAAGAAEGTCTAGGWCPGGVRVNYGSTGGRNTCPTKYPSSAASSNSELDCYVTTAAGKYVATVGAGQVNCAGTGYYCPGGTNVYSGAYGSRLTTGGRNQCPAGYRDLVATASTTKEAQCTMNVAGGKYVATAKESAASGTCAAGYAKAAHSVTYGNTSSCAACTGATYAASTGQASCTACPTAKTYASAVTGYGYWNAGKDGDHTISDGCYANFSASALDNGSMAASHCYLGTDSDYGNTVGKGGCWVNVRDLKCNAGYYNASANSGSTQPSYTSRTALLANACVGVGAGYYSAANILTRNQCPTGLTTIGYGAGADEVTDCGRILHFGNDKLYLRSGKKTTPSLNVKIGDTTYYGNMTAGTGKGKLRLKSGTTTYSVHDDSM